MLWSLRKSNPWPLPCEGSALAIWAKAPFKDDMRPICPSIHLSTSPSSPKIHLHHRLSDNPAWIYSWACISALSIQCLDDFPLPWTVYGFQLQLRTLHFGGPYGIRIHLVFLCDREVAILTAPRTNDRKQHMRRCFWCKLEVCEVTLSTSITIAVYHGFEPCILLTWQASSPPRGRVNQSKTRWRSPDWTNGVLLQNTAQTRTAFPPSSWILSYAYDHCLSYDVCSIAYPQNAS